MDTGEEAGRGASVVAGTIAGEAYGGMLIRPDGYVAWATGMVDEAALDRLRSALRRWFGPETT